MSKERVSQLTEEQKKHISIVTKVVSETIRQFYPDIPTSLLENAKIQLGYRGLIPQLSVSFGGDSAYKGVMISPSSIADRQSWVSGRKGGKFLDIDSRSLIKSAKELRKSPWKDEIDPAVEVYAIYLQLTPLELHLYHDKSKYATGGNDGSAYFVGVCK